MLLGDGAFGPEGDPHAFRFSRPVGPGNEPLAAIVLVCATVVLAVGLSWAHIWRRLTGQYAVDEIDN